MAILKKVYHTEYTVIPNSLAQSRDISYEAKGILLELLSRPENWVVYKTHFHSSTCKETKINRIFKELKNSGYIYVHTIMDEESGKILDRHWIVSGEPIKSSEKWQEILDYPNGGKTTVWSNKDKSSKNTCLSTARVIKDKMPKNTCLTQRGKNLSWVNQGLQSKDNIQSKDSIQNIYTQEFENCMSFYPQRLGTNNKKTAYKQYYNRRKEGEKEENMLNAVKNYQLFCRITEILNTEFVMQTQRFFGKTCEYLQFLNIDLEAVKYQYDKKIAKFGRKNHSVYSAITAAANKYSKEIYAAK